MTRLDLLIQAVLIGAALLGPAAVSASLVDSAGEFKTGKEIKVGLEGWVDKGSIEYVRDSMAFGYVIGVHDALAGSAVCGGGDVTQGKVVEVVLTYMRQNPEVLDHSADRVIAAALETVWPCEKK
jgi:hypothetical protein